MKALTIKQPFAHLIAADIKDIENRTWRTHFRGRIYIHASQKHEEGQAFMFLTVEQLKTIPFNTKEILIINKLDCSAIIGEVDIVDCIQNSDSVWAIEGHWHWVLRNPVLYDKPITNIKGKLSFWEPAIP